MKMLKTIFLASLAAMPLAAVESRASAAEIPHETVQVGYALGNVAEDALDLARAYERDAAIHASNAGYYLRELIDDNELLVIHAHELALLLDVEYPNHVAIANKFAQVSNSYNRVKSGSEKAVQYLHAQGRTTEGYQLRAAYTKVRTRYVYLQGAIGGR